MVRKIPTFSEVILSFHTKVLTIGNFPTSQQFMKMAPSFSRRNYTSLASHSTLVKLERSGVRVQINFPPRMQLGVEVTIHATITRN